jgi:hypothetical protein
MIRLLTSIAGTPQYLVGETVTLTPEIEAAWVAAGLAEPVSGHPETAMVSPVEQAMRPRKRGRSVRA